MTFFQLEFKKRQDGEKGLKSNTQFRLADRNKWFTEM